MHISDLAINRPVTTIMCILVVLILGFVSLTSLNVDLLPEMDFPVAMVMTSYPGAGPQEVESLVTKRLEAVLGTVSNVKNIMSYSMSGQSVVILELEWGTDLDMTTLEMREKIDLARWVFPDDVEQPMVMKMDPNMMPIMMFGLTGEMGQEDLFKLAEDTIAPRLERLPGVASVDISGGREREIRIELDPAKLSAYGITFTQVAGALQGDNLALSGGTVSKGSQDYLVRITGEFVSPQEIGQVAVVTGTGAQVRIKDLGTVIDGQKEVTGFSRINGRDSIAFSIQKQTTGNTVRVSQAVNKALAELKDELPANIEFVPIMDTAEFIQFSIDNVVNNLILGSLLAALVLYIFLRNLRSTLVIAFSIPVSVIGTFILMYFSGMTLNMMSLGGLALGVGMMVDNSIVILENIYRHREEGFNRVEAAKLGARQVAMAVTASTLTTVAVFVPIAWVEGIASQIFRQLALTITFSLAASLLVALTLIPMISSQMMSVTVANDQSKRKSFYQKMFIVTGRWLDKLDNIYRKVLAWSLKHRRRVVLLVILTLVLSLGLTPFIGSEFIPSVDQGTISISVSLPYGTKLAETEKVIARLEEICVNIPEVEVISASVGSGGLGAGLGSSSGSDSGSLNLALKPLAERSRSTEQVADEIRTRAKEIAGAEISVSAGDTMGMTSMMGAPINVVLKGDSLEKLDELASQVKDIISSIEGTREVKSSLDEGRPEVEVTVNRQKAAYYGLNAAQIAGTVRGAVQGQVVTTYRTDGDEYDVRLALPKESVKNLQDLSSLSILSPMGYQVPLSEVADFIIVEGPNTIERINQVRTVNVTAQIIGRDLNSIVTELEGKLAGLSFPSGYEYEMGGSAEMMAESFADLGLALILAIILVYMVMASQFESLFHPFVIMFTMPVTVIGVVLGLFLSGNNFNVVAFIGVIMLAGIVVNNGIVLIDYINVLRNEGLKRTEAILKAGPTRLRPILMTTLTTVLGMLPLALGVGEGGELSAPMGVVVIGGLTTSTLLTLIFVPVVYSIFDDWGARLSRKRIKAEKLEVKSLEG
ncbi:MAG: efflux RND transporter permease subunit [Zhaonellaceae bacterium]